MEEFYAHTVKNRPECEWETMAAHEKRVRRYCRSFLRRIDPGLVPWADVLGAWHDLGKYLSAFQKKLRLPDPRSVQVEHSGVGAAMAARFRGKIGPALAFAIAGHHAGLANYKDNDPAESAFRHITRVPLEHRLADSTADLASMSPALPASVVEMRMPAMPRWLRDIAARDATQWSYAFFTRMLFSALVDADRLGTAEFDARANGRVSDRRHLRYDPLTALRDRLDAHIDVLTASAAEHRPSPVNTMRAAVLAACRRAAGVPPGLFSLTVPTGGAKTLSGMSFALRHAVAHGLDRVIVVIPFTSIIEQNALRYRESLAVNGQPDTCNVLEHHSGIDEQAAEEADPEAEQRRRLAAENWDAPVVVTTSVQFFESLFSDHPSRCRKLHRIAKSVIVLDEVQTLPPALLLPILDALRELTANYGCTVVLSTATPPALTHRASLPRGLTGVRPIIENAVELAASAAARRVRIEWRTDRVTPYDELAVELATHKQVLAVVHRRADARLLAEKLPSEGRFHLSALMCPAHRLQKIAQINAALSEGKTCRIVSTQLIEAGVDIDLPVVYRALAGLDSIAQAAGRCDREGRLTAATGRPAGRVVVFRAATDPPGATLRKAAQSTETLLRLQAAAEGELDAFNPEHCELFFRELYGKERLDARNVQRESAALNFANVAAAFRMIDDAWSRTVVVPWGDGARRIEAFLAEPGRENRRALQPFLVQLPSAHVEQFALIGAVERWRDSDLYLPAALFGSRYDEEFGLTAVAGIDPELLVI